VCHNVDKRLIVATLTALHSVCASGTAACNGYDRYAMCCVGVIVNILLLQLTPSGMNYMIVFVVNFHPQFVTKVDRAYNVRCFYAQSDKTVTSQLEVR
jgi:hypothetical protein